VIARSAVEWRKSNLRVHISCAGASFSIITHSAYVCIHYAAPRVVGVYIHSTFFRAQFETWLCDAVAKRLRTTTDVGCCVQHQQQAQNTTEKREGRETHARSCASTLG